MIRPAHLLRVLSVCLFALGATLARAQLTFDPANPPASDAPPTEQYHHYTGAFPHQKGPKSVLVILVQPSDGATWTNPPAFATLDSSLNTASQNFYNASYRQTWFGPKRHGGLDIDRLVVTPVLVLPKTEAQYKASFGTLQADCLAAVRAQGGDWNGGRFDPNYYDRWVVMSNTKMIGSTGLAYVGGRFSWTGGGVSGGVAEHEWGHNWGVFHANDWTVPAGAPPRSSTGSNGEYQDGWDVMGGNNAGVSFNPQFRENLGFVERARGEALDVTTSGVYRLYDYIHPRRRQDAGLIRALVLPMESFTDPKRVILGFGHHGGTDGGLGRADWNRNAVTVHSKLSDGSNRIDTTPRSREVGDADDSSIKIGRTYSESAAVNGNQLYGGFHVTPVARGATPVNGVAHEWIDVVVNYQNAIANNQPPTLAFAQTVFTGASAGTPFALAVTASDPNGDTLAYDWDFGDDTYNLTNSASQSKTWSAPGLYLVRCTVSDMKGGTTTAHAWVSVGSLTYRPATSAPTTSGLHYRAYTGTWSALPDFDLLNPVASGTVAGFNLSVRPANNAFALLFTGYIDVPAQDVYQFSITCDDGARLFIGDQLVVTNDGLKSTPVTRVGNIALAAGKHPVRLEYFNKDNTASLQVQWWRVGQPTAPIPALSLVQPTWSGNAAPAVAITSPAAGESFVVNSDITITADASDDGALARVVFFVNGAFLAQTTTAPFATVWPKAPVGTHTLTAIATDTTGRWTRSSPLVFEVVSPPPTNGIGVNFGASTTTNTLFFNERAGAVYAYANWNNFNTGNATPAPLLDHNGSPTAATVATGGSGFSTNAETTTAPGKLLASGLYRRFDTEPGDFPNPSALVENIPYATYDVYVYLDTPETSTQDTLASRILLTPSEGDAPAPRFVRNSVTASDGVGDYPTYDTFTGFREATATALYDASEKLFGNYVVFRGLTAPAFFVESTRRNGSTVADGTTGRHDRYLNAIQIIETVPTAPALVVRQTAGGAAVSEQGAADSLTVALAFPPTATVTVSIQSDAQLTADKSTLTFTPANWNIAQAITVRAIDDTTPEGPHLGTLLLVATGGNYTGLEPRAVTVAIEDNDQPVVAVQKSRDAEEGGASGRFQFVRTSATSLASPLTLHFQMSGTASLSGDYTFSGASVSYNSSSGAGSVVIPAGQGQVFLDLDPVNDSVIEPDKTAVLTLVASPAYALGSPGFATVTLRDDDAIKHFTQFFSTGQLETSFDLSNTRITFTPDASGNFYAAAVQPATSYLNSATLGTQLVTANNDDSAYTANLPAKFYGESFTSFFVSPNGYLTFGQTDTNYTPSLANHFTRKRLSLFFADQYATNGTTTIYVGQTGSGATLRTVVTFNNLHVRGQTGQRYNAQVELWNNGVITVTWLNCHVGQAVVAGLSRVTTGLPSGFVETNLSAIGASTPTTNTAPTFVSLAPTLAVRNQAYSYTIAAADLENDALSFTAPVKPAWLSLTDHGNRTATLSGTPPASGSFPVTLQVSDGTLTATQAFTVLVVPASGNTAPVFTSSPVSFGNVGQLFTYAVTTSDSDNHTVSLAAVQLPGWLTFTATGPGSASLSGTIPDNDISSYPVALVASDGLAGTAQAFTLAVNRAPRITLAEPASGIVALPDRAQPLQLVATVTDDGQPASPGAVTTTWIQLEGPATAAFAAPSAASTAVSFPAPGVYRLRLTATDGALTSSSDITAYVESSPADALASGLRGHWRFNESSGALAADSSGQGRDLTLTGSGVFGPGVEGGAYVTTASNAQYAENTTLPYAAQTTWSAWVRSDLSPNDSSSVRVLFTHVDGGANARTRLGLKNASSQLVFNSPHQTQGVWETTTYRLPANEWVHVILTYDNSGTANHPVLQIDGAPVALTRTTAPSGSLIASTGLRLAGRSTSSETWRGRIDEVRLYNRILAPAELALLPLATPPNQAPLVTVALRDPVAEFANSAVLVGTAEDDGLPASPGAVTTSWIQVSGPGVATFADASALETGVTFNASGTFILRLTATDGAATTSADLAVTLDLATPVATRIAVTPAELTLRPSTAQTFSAVLFDQYERPVSPQPTFVWSTSGGTINSAGLFTASATEDGPHNVTATAASISGTAQLIVFNNPPTLGSIADQTLALGRTLAPIDVTIDDVETPAAQLTLTATSSNPTLLPPANLALGGSGADRTLTLTPAPGQTGVSTVTLHLSDGHKTTTRALTFAVQPRTATAVVVSPAAFSLPPSESGSFSAVVLDQVGDPVSPHPTLTWSVSGGGAINASGVFTAGASPGGPHTVTATAGSLSGTAAVTVRAAGAFAWTGAASADWHDPANWSSFVPGPSDIALFDAANVPNQPSIIGSARVRGLRFLSTSGPVEISGGTLELGAAGLLNGGQIRGTTTASNTSIINCDPLITAQLAELLALGQLVTITGTNIPANSTVTAVSGTSLTLSQAATGGATNTYSLNAATTSPITISSAVVLTTGQAWQLGSILTVSGNLSGSGDLRIGATNNSNGTTLPWLRLTGQNAAYTGTISFANPITQNSAGLLLGSASAMTGGLIHLESPASQNYNLWLTGGPASGTYTFGLNGTQTTGPRIQTRSANGGLFTTGGPVAWDPGSGSDYAWSAASGVTYATFAGTDASTPSPVHLGNDTARFTISGGNKTFAVSGAGNHRGLVTVRSALADGNETSARTLTTSLPLLRLTRPAVNQHATARLNLTVTGGTLAISDVAQLPGGNLNLNGGTLLLDGVTWEQFAAARQATPAAGNARWQGTLRFAARGETPLTLDPALLDVATFGFGSSARDPDGNSAFAGTPVRVTGPVTYGNANRIIEVTGTLARDAATGAYSGFDRSPVHEISGVIGGLGAGNLLVFQGANNSAAPEGESAGALRLSAANTFTGTVLLGTNSLAADTGNPAGFGVLLATSDSAFGHAANEVVVASGGRGWALLLEDSAGNGATFSRAFRYDLRGSSSVRSWAFGAHAGQVTYTGTLTVQPQSGQTITTNTTHNLNLHAEPGSLLRLGAPGAPATFANQANAAATANLVTLLYRKTGGGLAILDNVQFTSANANLAHAFAITAGTLRETGTGATNSLNGARLALGGSGVLESSGDFTRTLGTAAGQLQWFGGGFAARGGELSVTISATAPNTEWGDANFLSAGSALVFGSPTANATVSLANSIALASSDNVTVTREIRVIDNPASTADRAVLLGNLRNRGDGGDGGTGARNLLKTGDGLLELAAPNNDLLGSVTVAEGTLFVSGKLTAFDLTVASDGTLAGDGIINAAVTVAADGSLAFHLATPPAAHPRLTLGDRLNFMPGAKLLLSADLAPGVATYVLARASGGITGPLPTLIKPSGIHAHLAVSGNNLLLVTGEAPPPPPPPTPFETWIADNFTLEQVTAGLADPTADPDGDGLPNLLEYALDSDPLTSGSFQLPTASVSGNSLQLSFLRARAELTYEVLASSDLVTWTVIATNPGQVGQPVTVTDPVSNTSRRFLRLRVTQ